MMPVQKPGRSKQDYETPRDLLDAVEARWGKLEVDLAATPENAKAPFYITPEQNSLSLRWPADRVMWLNPPYGDIKPWAQACAEWTMRAAPRGRILFLVPASVGASWFWKWVWSYSLVWVLTPRPSFDGKHPFPKDVMLCEFFYSYPSPDLGERLNEWRWK
jgi:phage N-6-adenine-methyltransferase